MKEKKQKISVTKEEKIFNVYTTITEIQQVIIIYFNLSKKAPLVINIYNVLGIRMFSYIYYFVKFII